MRSTVLFNNNWLYTPAQVGDDVPDSNFEQITLPHSNKLFPHHNFDEQEYKFISTYRKRFTLPEPLDGRRLYLDFDGVMIASTVTLNGHTFEEYRGGFTPFSFDITDYLNQDGANLLTVSVDSTERKDIPPYGHVVDYLLFGGIYRDVWLRYVNPVHITNVFVKTFDVLTDDPRVEVDVTVRNQTDAEYHDHVSVLLGLGEESPLYFGLAEHLDVPAGETLTQSILIQGEELLNRNQDWINQESGEPYTEPLQLQLWSLDTPYLYTLAVDIGIPDEDTPEEDAFPLDSYDVKFGFRDAVFKDDGFYLNGERLQLRGLNRHQNYPYIGPAAPKRLQEKDADIVKYELGCNIVRTSHYPQSPYFLNRCDEIGLLVFEEIPGWQHIGDEAWQALSIRDVRTMIERDWNHPAIILWGVRINESLDNTEFYRATNKLAHELDPTRQTGGVRFWQHSEFLEDVYTFNDFSNSIEEPVHTPHLVCEFNGHMFPTKTFDNEERLMEHARRHAYIQSRAATIGGVSGAIGWCSFDYNTHQEFGSGDRICYHGVSDIFRLPKWAAYFYGSQVPPEERVVLQAATSYTMGDRATGGNDPILILSNCDEIEVYLGDVQHGVFRPDSDHYPNLPHPPFTVPMTMEWGQRFHDLRIVGLVNGSRVAEQIFPLDPHPTRLQLCVDDTALNADGADMTRVSFKVVDQHDNPLRYAMTVVSLEITGPGQLIGTNPFPLAGGQAAVYLKATHETGMVTIKASAPRLDPVEVTVKMV